MRVSQIILDQMVTLREFIRALTNRLTFQDNFQATVIVIDDSGPANTEFIVQHTLDTIPTGYIANMAGAGDVYDSDRDNWTTREIKLKCTLSNAKIYLVIF